MPRKFTEAERHDFLAAKHVAVLSVATDDGRPPASVPIWYDYTPGGNIRINTGAGNRKARLIERAGAITLTVQHEEPMKSRRTSTSLSRERLSMRSGRPLPGQGRRSPSAISARRRGANSRAVMTTPIPCCSRSSPTGGSRRIFPASCSTRRRPRATPARGIASQARPRSSARCCRSCRRRCIHAVRWQRS